METITKTIGDKEFKFAKWTPFMGIQLFDKLKNYRFSEMMRQADSITNPALQQKYLEIAMNKNDTDSDAQANGLKSATFILLISGQRADQSFTEKDAEFILDSELVDCNALFVELGAYADPKKKATAEQSK